jgi:Tol biopolymer transport system component
MLIRAIIVVIALLLSAALSVGADDALEPEPPPDQRILFFSDQHDPNWRLYSMKPDGTDVQQVAEHPDELPRRKTFRLEGADLSPDGRILAYIQLICPDVPHEPCSRELHLLMLETGEIQPLTEGPFDWNPIWSPDGQFIAFYNRDTFPYAAVVEVSTGEIVLNINAPLLRPLGDGSAGYLLGMSWAPDSERLVFSVSNPPDGDTAPYLITLAGEVERISESIKGFDPAWQPDSDMIYYRCVGEPAEWVCRVDLTTRIPEPVPGLQSQLEAVMPERARIGGFNANSAGELLFTISVRNVDNLEVIETVDIYHYDTNTNTLTNLTENAGYNGYHPRWYMVPSAGAPPTADAGPDQTAPADDE